MYLVAFILFYANAQHTRIIHHYKNYTEKLLKTNTTIWFNRICRFNHLMPKYIHIAVSSNKANNKLLLLLLFHQHYIIFVYIILTKTSKILHY